MIAKGGPVISISCGDPAGIGPEITAKLALKNFTARVVAVADCDILGHAAETSNVPVKLRRINSVSEVSAHVPGELFVKHVPTAARVTPGTADAANAEYVINCLETCVDWCLNGQAAAMVTGPVNKAVINDGGYVFSGHTEWIAERCGGSHPVMMLANSSLRVCLVTTHVPLREVHRHISEASLERVIRIINTEISRLYDITRPVIGVCGLNPHAGESGHLGREEIEIIGPVLEKLRDMGIDCRGPLPADTLFTQSALEEVDVVLAMYHDQGLPVIKHSGFGEVVNITLGLPIIRTSVDHGTAMDVAGKGQASASSMEAAVRLAMEFANNHNSTDRLNA